MNLRRKITYRWFRLEIFKDGKWEDAGDVYEEETKRDCRREMVCVNFYDYKVRMVEYVTASRPVGKVVDMGKRCYRLRSKKSL